MACCQMDRILRGCSCFRTNVARSVFGRRARVAYDALDQPFLHLDTVAGSTVLPEYLTDAFFLALAILLFPMPPLPY